MNTAEVVGINIYPVKSLNALALSTSDFTGRGLDWDRRWMMIDEKNHFVSQRSHPIIKRCKLEDSDGGFLISLPDGQSQHLPKTWTSTENLSTTMFDDFPLVSPYDGAANELMSEFLGQKVRFCYQRKDQVRPTDSKFSRDGDHFSLADGYPILVANRGSLLDLNERLEKGVDMTRFRPNIVVDGDFEAWDEDQWTKLSKPGLSWRVVKACARCSVTTVDENGKLGKEPLRTLNKFRKREGKVYFGMNIIPDHSGKISVGDHLSIQY